MQLRQKATLYIFAIGLLSACNTNPPNETRNSAIATPSETPFSIPTVLEISPTITATIDPIATSRPYRLQPGELVLAASPGDIPAIFAEDDLFVSVDVGNTEWNDAELVIGVAINGDARAYPVRLLSLHEVVNDVVGGQPIAVTWCPLCYTAITYNRVLDRELTFGASGYLFHNNLVMYDHQSNTLWSQMLGQSLRGAYTRTQLEILPSVLTSWEKWKAEYPNTKVLSWVQLGKLADEVFDPYVGYYTSGAAGLGGQGELDDRLLPKSLVVGLKVAKISRAYPLETIKERAIINDQIDELPIILVYNTDFNNVFVYDRRHNGQILTFIIDEQTGYLRDNETGSLWDEKTGISVEGDLAGSQLRRLSGHVVFWFAWSDIHSDTEVYTFEELDK